jgi:hypothetical protein
LEAEEQSSSVTSWMVLTFMGDNFDGLNNMADFDD